MRSLNRRANASRRCRCGPTHLFHELGNEETGRDRVGVEIPSGPSFDNDNNLKLFAALIHKAQRRISITSPYFVPDESIMLALITAGSRGLDVELFLYKAPTVLHAQHLSIDDDVAVIGSSNMDLRSLNLHFEISVLVHGRDFVDRMRVVEDQYRLRSTEVHLEEWLRRPWGQQVRDNLSRLTSSLQ